MTMNRRLDIEVTFHATHNDDNSYGGSATYRQTGSLPDLGTVVASNGAIDLTHAPAYDPALYNENVDIYFTLVGNTDITPDGTNEPVVWASVNGAAMQVLPPENGTAGEFSVEAVPGHPEQILIRDKDDDSNTYNYKPAIELPLHNHYYISLDPPIYNRPPAR